MLTDRRWLWLTTWLVLLVCAPPARCQVAANWPQWRGPLGTGVAPDATPPTEWNRDKNVRWKTALPGRGHSTPIVWNERVFVTAAVAVGPKLPPRPSGRPGAHDNLPVTSEYKFVVMAINRKDGSVFWEKSVHRAVPLEGAHYTASLASASPVTDGKHVFAHFGSHGLYCLDFDGDVIWECGGMSANIVATPVSAGGILYVGSSYEKRALMAIRITGASGDITDTDHVLWQRSRGTPYVPSPLLYGESLYYLTHYQNIITRIQAESGTDDPGAFRLGGIGNVYASPVGAGKHVFVTDLDGVTLVLTHSPIPRLVAVNRLGEKVSASAAIVDREIFLRGDKHLFCLAEGE